jgi:tRNA(Ile)-lysidine synthase
MDVGDLLLTAHHCDDQAETVLLQLLRGAGVRGLAAMPELARFGAGRLARPLLSVSRQSLLRYAQQHRLHWVEDPSNLDATLDRNMLRARIMPVLNSRWPATADNLTRSASHCSEAEQLLGELARLDGQGISRDNDASLDIGPLLNLSPARRRNLLRQWLAWHGHSPPSSVVLKRIVDEVAGAAQSRQPLVAWGGSELRRHNGRLFALSSGHETDRWFRSDLAVDQAVTLPDGGQVRLHPGIGGIDPARVGSMRLQVGYRRGGERLRVRSKGAMRSLKNLFQEADVPPWERQRIPILYAADRVVAVAGCWVNCDFACSGEDCKGLLFEWYPRQPSATL